MARKKKVVIVDQELVPTVLAVKADKKKISIFSVIWVFFIFAVFAAGAYYLPDIAAYVNAYLHPEDAYYYGEGNNDDDYDYDDEENQANEKHEYVISDNPQVVIDDLNINGFQVLDTELSFVIHNNSSEIIELSDYNYFLTLFNEEKKLLQRIMVNDGVVSPNGDLNMKYSLVDGGVSIFTFENIGYEDYPQIILKNDSSSNATLICKKDNETITYYVNENKLYAIGDLFTVPSDNADYSVMYSTYQALANTYNSIGGVSSSINVVDNVLNFNTIINLNTLSDGTFNSKIYYPKDTDAKIMKFELEASGYNCE